MTRRRLTCLQFGLTGFCADETRGEAAGGGEEEAINLIMT